MIDPRNLPQRIAQWAPQLEAAFLCYAVDPYLVAAVIDRESLWGEALHPQGPGGTGDRGHGHGLGQIDDRHHKPFLDARFDDGTFLWAEPPFAVLYTARLLAVNLKSGDLVAAIGGYNCGLQRARGVLHWVGKDATFEQRVAAVDAITTGQNYVSDVLARRDRFKPPETA